MNSNKLSKLFLAVLSSAVILQTAAFAFTPEELEARESLHRSVRESEVYQTASRTKQLTLQPFFERNCAFHTKARDVEARYDEQIEPLKKRLAESQAHTDSEIARLTQESDELLAAQCAPLHQQRDAAEAAFQKESAPFREKISAILRARQERSAFDSKNAGKQSLFFDYLDDQDSAMRTAAENKAMAPLKEAIAALRQHHVEPIEKMIESAKSKSKSLLKPKSTLL